MFRLHPFVSNPPMRHLRIHLALVSLAVHAGLLTMLVTSQVPAASSGDGIETATDATMPTGPGVRRSAPARHRTQRAVKPVPRRRDELRLPTSVRLNPVVAEVGHGSGARADSVAYIAAQVDRAAVGSSANRKPAYPSELADRMVQATFSVYFVVDARGRVDAATIEVPPSVDRAFARAVRDVLGAWRFTPAELRGRPVRQLVEQTIAFRIDDKG